MDTDTIVLTGYACTTSLGMDAQTTWQAISEGKIGIDRLKQWDGTDWPYSLGGEIKRYDPRTMLKDRKLLKVLSRHDVIGLHAASQAIEHSQLLDYRAQLSDDVEFNDRTGIFVASPGNKFYQQHDFLPLIANGQGDTKQFAEHLFSEVHPMWLLKILPNNVLAYTGVQYGFKGANENVTNHGVSGLQAVIEAYHYLQQGIIDRAIVIAYDSGFEAQCVFYYGHMGLLSGSALKSFDQNRDGTILAEGAAAIVLERAMVARQRQASIYAEILGGATCGEANGIFSVRNNAAGMIDCIQHTLDKTQISPDQVGLITAHANGNVRSDATEVKAIRHCFGDDTVPVTGFKWALGHTLSAAGLIDTVLSVLTINKQIIPGIANLEQLARDCSGIRVQNTPYDPHTNLALVMARGFGSLNSCLLLRGYQ